jgi:hypothetical protein
MSTSLPDVDMKTATTVPQLGTNPPYPAAALPGAI